MLKRFLFVCAFLFFGGAVNAGQAFSASAVSGGHDDVRFSLEAGWRQDSFDWNIASDATGAATPNVMSELRWRKLSIAQVRGAAEIEMNGLVLRGSAAYGGIARGVNEDSDYAGDNRTLEWSRSHNDAKGGYTADLDGSIGWRWHINEAWSVTPMAGYAWHRQSLRMRNGVQVVAKAVVIGGVLYRAPPLGPFPGLNSQYEADWQGPWLGGDIAWRYGAWHMFVSGRYEWSQYRARADWNLRRDLMHPVSFRHRAHGGGWRTSAGFAYDWKGWAWGASVDWLRFDAGPGADVSYPVGGGAVQVRLNGVHWRSASVMLHVSKTW